VKSGGFYWWGACQWFWVGEEDAMGGFMEHVQNVLDSRSKLQTSTSGPQAEVFFIGKTSAERVIGLTSIRPFFSFHAMNFN
jgi:hypothetical protein